MKAKLMDFEFSKTKGTITEFYKDIRYGLIPSLLRYISIYEFIDSRVVDSLVITIGKVYDKSDNCLDILEILDIIDRF